MTTKQLPPIRRLTCCCCGESTIGRQWWNRDTGFGLCADCIPFVSRGESAEGLQSTYGTRGVHYDIPVMTKRRFFNIAMAQSIDWLQRAANDPNANMSQLHVLLLRLAIRKKTD